VYYICQHGAEIIIHNKRRNEEEKVSLKKIASPAAREKHFHTDVTDPE